MLPAVACASVSAAAGRRDGQQLNATDAAVGTSGALEALEAASSSEDEEGAFEEDGTELAGSSALLACSAGDC